jgi:hypothetical protein
MDQAKADHNKILAAVARDGLGRMGLTRKGRSRTWLDDHGWWVIWVEFQPSSRSRGSYLNVGHQHLWLETDHIALGDCQRVRLDGEEFIGFDADRPDLFHASALRLVDKAVDAVAGRRNDHHDGLAALRAIAKHDQDGLHRLYDSGVALGLQGRSKPAGERFSGLLDVKANQAPPWVADLKEHTRTLASLLTDADMFHSEVNRRISATRTALKLPPCADLF